MLQSLISCFAARVLAPVRVSIWDSRELVHIACLFAACFSADRSDRRIQHDAGILFTKLC